MKKIFLFITVLLCTYQSFCQIDTSRQDLAQLFSQLNKALIPTGYLSAWGTDMADREDYNGLLTDSNTTNNMDMLRMLYADIYTARFSPTAATMPNIETLNSSIDNAANNPIVLNTHIQNMYPTNH